MRQIIVFGLIAVAIAAAAIRFIERTETAPAEGRAAASSTGEAQSSSDPRTMVVRRDERGHFRVTGTVDGRHMNFLVDTGASAVVLPEREAARIGVRPTARDYKTQVKTANGSVRAAPVTLKKVEIGWLRLTDVDALVLPDSALGENLLGLSFLSRLRRFEFAQNRLVLEQ
jgi:aspartyl protease family protein